MTSRQTRIIKIFNAYQSMKYEVTAYGNAGIRVTKKGDDKLQAIILFIHPDTVTMRTNRVSGCSYKTAVSVEFDVDEAVALRDFAVAVVLPLIQERVQEER